MLDYGTMFSPDGTQFKWNSHSLGAYLKCPRYYQYSIIEGWDYPERSVHLVFGGHYADSLHHYFLCRAHGADREEAIHSMIRNALEVTWDHETNKPWETDHAKDRFTLIRTLVWYFEEFRDDLPVLWFDGKPAVEWKFAIAADDGNYFVGTIDRAVDYAGAHWVMDQKTTGTTITPNFFKQFNPHSQMSQYTFAGQMIFDQPISGVIIDAVQIAVGFSRFERGQVYRTKSQLDEWYDDSMRHIKAAQAATRENHFPMNPESCGNYGGCTFRKICSMSPEVRKNYLRGTFTQNLPPKLGDPS